MAADRSSPHTFESYQALLSSALDGNTHARALVCTLCTRPMTQAIYRVLQNKRSSEVGDILQDAFERLLKSLPSIQQAESLTSFASQLAANTAKSYLQRNGYHRMLPTDPLASDTMLAGTPVTSTAEHRLDASRRVHTVESKLLPRLTPIEYQVYQLLYKQELQPREVAEQLKITRNYVDQCSFQIRRLWRSIDHHP